MITNKQLQFINSLADPEYRKAFADEMVGTGLAFQIRLLRNARNLTQKALADRVGNNQVTISQWENPNYGRYSINTLKQLAAAFDVGLLVRFVSFSELADWTIDVRAERLTPPSYDEERQLSFGGISAEPAWKGIEDQWIDAAISSPMAWSGTELTADNNAPRIRAEKRNSSIEELSYAAA